MPDVPNLSQGAQRARREQAAAEEAAKPPEVLEAETAFIIFITQDGHVGSTPDLDQAITKRREPTAEDVQFASLRIHDEIHDQGLAARTAQQVIQMSMQVQSQMRAAAEQAKVQQDLAAARAGS